LEKTKKSGTISKSKSVQVQVKKSNYHIVIEPTKISDKNIIQGIIKKFSVGKPISQDVCDIKRSFKTVVILNTDELTYQTQAFLRRTMEQYSKTCRFILCCNNLSKINPP